MPAEPTTPAARQPGPVSAAELMCPECGPTAMVADEHIAGLPAATGVRVAVLRFGCLLPAGGCGVRGLSALRAASGGSLAARGGGLRWCRGD